MQGLGNDNVRQIFLGIEKGRITLKTTKNADGTWNKEQFGYVEGHLKEIRRREITFADGSRDPYVDFIIENGGNTFNLSIKETGNSCRSIVLSLANVQNFIGNTVKITAKPSKNGKYTNVYVSVNGQDVDWVTKNFPRVEDRPIPGQPGKTYKDDSKLSEFIRGYLDIVIERIRSASQTPSAAASAGEEQQFIGGDDLVGDGEAYIDPATGEYHPSAAAGLSEGEDF